MEKADAQKPHTQKDIDAIVHRISFHPAARKTLFVRLPYPLRANVLLQLSKHIRHDLTMRLSDDELLATLEHLDPDEATDIIQLLPGARQKKITDRLTSELRRGVEILNQFDPQTAAGIMNLDYIQIEEADTIAKVARQFKVHEKRTGRLPAIIAVREGKVTGYVPGHELGFGRPGESVKKYIRRITRVRHNAPKEDIVRLFKTHPHNKIAVVGNRGNIMGIIYSDDMLRLLQEEESASLYDFAGVHDEESVTDSTRVKVLSRYKWLMVNLGTAFLASFTVGLFDETISTYVLLAVYMPIVAGMGGNAGTQTLAVLVRGITLRQIDLAHAWPTLKRELGAGLVNGVINGALVAGVVILVNRDVKIALILGLAMIVNLFVAGLFGTIVPLIMKRLHKDPATSATIFITTATDVLGFLAFLGMATLILS